MASTESSTADLLPGYFVEPSTGAWLTLRWPALTDLPPSLGPQVIEWCHANLVHHLTGEDWRFTAGQRRFIHMWYALRPDGRWLYRSGVKRGAKGVGKDPLGAALALVEMMGPVVPVVDGGVWRGAATEHRLALVQIVANSEAQAADMLRVANAMVKDDVRDDVGFDAGVLRSQLPSGSRIELLTNSERSSEGDPATAIFLNESHHMTRMSGGQKLAGVARRNVGKSPGGRARLLELTNAHMPSEGSVAEDSFDAWQAQVGGRTKRVDILYDSREAAPDLRLHVDDELVAGIAQAYADAPWIDQERIRDEAQDPRTPTGDSVRFYFNALPTNELAWVDSRRFDALARTDEVVADGEPVVMFLDCSKSQDATTLVGVRLSDGHVMALGGWQRPHGDRGAGWLAPRNEVDAAVQVAFERWSVQWFGVDPSPARDDETEAQYWAAQVDEWHRRYHARLLLWATPGRGGNSVLFDMRLSSPGGHDRNRVFTEMAELTKMAIDEDGGELLTWNGDPMLRQHTHNARNRSNQWGMSLGKRTRDSADLVDYAVTMVGARLGRRMVLNSGKLQTAKKRSGVVL